MASQQFNKASKVKNKKQKNFEYKYFLRQDFEYMGENNTFYFFVNQQRAES
jgi:hypothetical protein